MPTTSGAAVADACVLIPAALCDFLLRAAAAELYRLCWSDDILDEVRRTLVGDLGIDVSRADRRIAAMKAAFPEALVTGYGPLISGVPTSVDANDRHVVAAAVAGSARIIITSNLRDFPASALTPLGIEARSPDEFLLDLAAADSEAVKQAIVEQAAALTAPAMAPLDIVHALRRDAPMFAAFIEPIIEGAR